MQQTHHATDAWCIASLQMTCKKFPCPAAASQTLGTKLELLQSWEADINKMLKLVQDTQHGFGCLPSQTTDEPTLQAAKIQLDVQLDCPFSSQPGNACNRLAVLMTSAKSSMPGLENMHISKADSMHVRRELEAVHTVLMHAFWEVIFFSFNFLIPINVLCCNKLHAQVS